MTIQSTAETIAVWIGSCVKESQLNLCQDVIDKFIRERYKNHSKPGELAMIESDLSVQILEQRTRIQTVKEPTELNEQRTLHA
jgi:hypothetical protein